MLDVDRTTPAVVLRLDANPFHHGGLGVIRSLGRLGVPVYAVHGERFSPAAGSRYLRGSWQWRPGPERADLIRVGLRQLAEEIGRPAVLIPTDDAGALFLAEYGDELDGRYLFHRPESGLPRRLADKLELFQLCQQVHVHCPDTIRPESVGEAITFATRTGFPVVVKLSRPWRGSGALRLRSTTVVTDRAELTRICAAALAADTPNLLLQQYLPGGPTEDWFCHGFCDADSVLRPAFTGRKIRSYPAHAGLTSLGRTEHNAEIVGLVRRLVQRIGYRGILDIDLRRDPRDGHYKVLDFNPRIGAQFRLFADDAGVDVAIAAHLDLTGRPVPPGTPLSRSFVVENYDPLAALGYWRRGELGLRSWLGSLRGVDELAWFARDDLVPFGRMCARMAWRALQRPIGSGSRPGVPTPPRYRPGRAHSTRKAIQP